MVGRLREGTFVVFVVLLLSTALPVTGSLAVASTAGDVEASHQERGLGDAAFESDLGSLQANNTTRQHDNPANLSENGDLLGVRGWLSNRLLERLSTGAIELDQGQYEQARSLLGTEFDSRLEQFVDVIGETDTESDDDSDDPYRRAQRNQRNLTDTAQSYDETYESYQEAVANGNQTAARQRARQLQRLADDAQRYNRTTIRQYETIENRTEADLDRAITSLTNVSENITERQQEIDETLFTGTELRLTPEDTAISYTDPLVASGQLLTESGEPVANRDIRIQIATRTQTLQTDDDGQFELQYRPRTVSVNRSSFTVEYLPENSSEYLTSDTTITVDIEQVSVNLSVESAPERAAFGDELDTTSRLELDGEPVRGIPVQTTLGAASLGQQITDESGTASVREQLPAGVPDGERQLTVSVSLTNAAVTASPINRPVTVEETPTNLSVQANQSGSTQLTVDGTLSTVDGRQVSDQPVQITVAETIEETVRTGQNGTYALTIDGTQLSTEGNASLTVAAEFDGTGTNLGSASTTTRIDYQNATGGQSDSTTGPLPSDIFPGGDSIPPEALGGLGALVILLAILLVVRRRYADSTTDPGGSNDESAASESDVADEAAATGSEESATAAAESTGDPDADDETLDFTPAETFLRDGNRAAAVRYTYQHLRSHVADQVGATDADTHWEFFNRCRDGGMDEPRLGTLRRLVETYEATEFRPGSESDADVESLLDSIDAQWAQTS